MACQRSNAHAACDSTDDVVRKVCNMQQLKPLPAPHLRLTSSLDSCLLSRRRRRKECTLRQLCHQNNIREPMAIDLMMQLLQLDPAKRIDAYHVRQHSACMLWLSKRLRAVVDKRLRAAVAQPQRLHAVVTQAQRFDIVAHAQLLHITQAQAFLVVATQPQFLHAVMAQAQSLHVVCCASRALMHGLLPGMTAGCSARLLLARPSGTLARGGAYRGPDVRPRIQRQKEAGGAQRR